MRAGVQRLMRLPFVFTAGYALEPGSDDTRRVVVFSVRENNRYWFLLDGRFGHVNQPVDMAAAIQPGALRIGFAYIE